MTGSTIKGKLKKAAIGVAVTVFWLAVWQGLRLLVGQELLVPSPLSVLRVLWHSVLTAAFWKTVGISLLRILVGFLGAVAGGCLLAVLTVHFPLLHTLLAPVLHIIKAAPVASFIILALVWLPTGVLPAFICGLMVLPVVWNNVQQGIREIDPKLLQMAKVFRMGRWRTLTKVRLPAVMPYFLTAVTTGLGFAWKSGIAAEVICQPKAAIGKRLYLAKIYLETPEVFAWTAVVIVLSVVLERLLSLCLRRLMGKYSVKRGGAGQ